MLNKMTFEIASEILKNPKDHWSHEQDWAREYALKAFLMLGDYSEFADAKELIKKLNGETLEES